MSFYFFFFFLYSSFCSLFVFLGFITLGGVAMDLGIPKRRKQDSERVVAMVLVTHDVHGSGTR